jgi:hypothetical protein
MRCAALSARTLALPVTKSLKVSEGSTPDALTSKPAIVCGAGAGAGRLAGVSTGALSLAAGTRSSGAARPPTRSSGMARRRGCTVMRTWRTSARAIFHASERRSAKRSATQLAENSVGRNRSSVPVSLQKLPSWIGLIHCV